jgi:large conductance mechanosensitive channel
LAAVWLWKRPCVALNGKYQRLPECKAVQNEANRGRVNKETDMSDLLHTPKFALPKPGWVDDFKAFIMRGNVVDLAVGVVIGVAFTGIVNSLVKDVINPIIGLITGGVDFSNHFIRLRGPAAQTLADAQKAGDVTVNYGLFLNALINFLIVAAAIFWMIRLLQKLYKSPPPAAPLPTPTETLLTEIRDLLKASRAA